MSFMQPVSPKDMAKHDALVRALYASSSVEDQIAAILMDLRIGGSSDTENIARVKSRAIIVHLLKLKT